MCGLLPTPLSDGLDTIDLIIRSVRALKYVKTS